MTLLTLPTSPGGALAGRDAELTALRGLTAAVRTGGSGVRVLEGPAGSGKSSLLRVLAAESEDLRLLRATGIEAEADVPFAALDALLRPLLDRRNELPARQAEALEAALALGPPLHGGERFAIGAATLGLLALAAADDPVLCLVDDAHWIDEPSLAALCFAARRLGSEGVGMVLAVRPGRPGPPGLAGLPTTAVGPLGDAAARAVLRELAGPRVPRETADAIVRAAGGNPLLLREIAGRLDADERAGRRALVGPPPPGESADELLARRLERLPARARDALLVVAAADRTDVDLLEAALAHAGLALADLAAAEADGLVELGAAQAVIRQPLVRSVTYHRAGADRRRAAHAAVAAALPGEDHARAWHLAAACVSTDEHVARGLEDAAERARRSGGFASAGRALARAAELTPHPARRGARLHAAAREFERAGMGEDAARVLDGARTLPLDPATAARVAGMQAGFLLRRGHAAEARPELLRRADELGAAHPEEAARLLLEATYASIFLGDMPAAEQLSERALGLVAHLDVPLRRAAAAMRASTLIIVDRVPCALPLVEQLEDEVLGRDPADTSSAQVAEFYAQMVLVAFAAGRRAEARRLVERLLADARAAGAAGAVALLLVTRATLDVHSGALTAALAGAGEAVSLAEASEAPVVVVGALGVRALAHAHLGHLAEADADAARALELQSSSPGLRTYGLLARGVARLGRGRLEEAASLLAEAEAARARDGWAQPNTLHATPELIETLVRLGDREGAMERLERWETLAARSGADLAAVTAARCRGLLVPDAEIDAHFAAALAAAEELDLPFQRARILLCHGERLRRARRRVDARAPLRDALAIFDGLGYADWAVWARRELRAAGGMVPPVARPRGTGELTDHEAQVALMAAQGMTNREIAAALFLSPKTIEHHVSAILLKLGVRRRAALAPLFAGRLAGGAAEEGLPALAA